MQHFMLFEAADGQQPAGTPATTNQNYTKSPIWTTYQAFKAAALKYQDTSGTINPIQQTKIKQWFVQLDQKLFPAIQQALSGQIPANIGGGSYGNTNAGTTNNPSLNIGLQALGNATNIATGS